MNTKALDKLTYGLFVLTTHDEKKDYGCIINCAIQVTFNPNQICICVNKENHTHDMILKTRSFTVSSLSTSVKFETISNFGFQSGRKVDKFYTFEDCRRNSNGDFYITAGTNCYISAAVNNVIDLGTHTLFVGNITEMEVLSEEPSCTYEFYLKNIKPQPQAVGTTSEGKTIWKCTICGYEYVGEEIAFDFICPNCKHPSSYFVKIEQTN